MNPTTKQQLMGVSTATLCTALFKRGLHHQFIQDVRPLNPGLPNMVGEAYTLRYMPAREDLNTIEVFKNREHPQRRAVEECPPGAVFVIDSRKDARAASAGGILVTRLMKRGVAGIVTDGGFRDSPDIAKMPFPVYHQRPAAPTNLTVHQAIDINVPIGCGDAPVFPGDVVVGDAEGVVVIPAHLADEVAAEAVEMTVFEDFVQQKVMEGRSILGLYPPTDEQSRAPTQRQPSSARSSCGHRAGLSSRQEGRALSQAVGSATTNQPTTMHSGSARNHPSLPVRWRPTAPTTAPRARHATSSTARVPRRTRVTWVGRGGIDGKRFMGVVRRCYSPSRRGHASAK
jgi:regulator of RNase E activity RraA